MKLIIAGRRAPYQSRAAMRRHMLHVHGPMVAADMKSQISSYIQNYVRDGRYGANAPIGRDMVAELTFESDGVPSKTQRIIEDEANFAHLSDRFPMFTTETPVQKPPAQAQGADSGSWKVLSFLAPASAVSAGGFAVAWAQLDAIVLGIPGIIGYTRSVALPSSPPSSPYKGVASLWFKSPEHGEAGLTQWIDSASNAGFEDTALSFALCVEERRII